MVTRQASSSLCRSCQRRLLAQQSQSIQQHRSLSSTQPRLLPTNAPAHKSPSGARVWDVLNPNGRTPTGSQPNSPSPSPASRPGPSAQVMDIYKQTVNTSTGSSISANQPYHLNLYSHKHNTHITFTSPNFDPILSFSCGQIGLRKGQRGSFDAAYQLCTFMFRKMAMAQWRQGGKKRTENRLLTMADVGNKLMNMGVGIEVVLRGYGMGREALQKALLGQEGADIRKHIHKVTDGTRLKFGGTRSPAVRRLG